MAQQRILRIACAVTLLFVSLPGASALSQQKIDNFNRERARAILRDAYDNVKKHYYDPKFHGLDVDARFHQFDEKIGDAGSLSQSFGVIAAFLDGLNDSHTFFTPLPDPIAWTMAIAFRCTAMIASSPECGPEPTRNPKSIPATKSWATTNSQ